MIPQHCIALLIVIAFGASGCQRKLTPAEQAAADDRAVSMVVAAQEQHGPIKPLAPQAITVAEIEQQHMPGGCRFERAGEIQPIVLTGPKRAVMKLADRPAVFASDPGGPQGPLGTWEHYVGKGLSMRIERAAGDGLSPGQDVLQWSAKLTLRDEYDRIAFVASGTLRCGV
jgi:hypothetical protein